MTNITVDDIVKYITYIRINFENAYRTNNQNEYTVLIKGWYNSLCKYPKEIVDVAVNKAVENSEFAPRLATIIKEIEKMQVAFEKSDAELWAELKNCLREVENNVYMFRFTFREANGLTQGDNARQRVNELFVSLSPELQEYCRDVSGLIELATSDGLNYEKGRFLKAMPQIKERAKTRQTISSSLENLIKGLAANLTLDCADAKQIEGGSKK